VIGEISCDATTGSFRLTIEGGLSLLLQPVEARARLVEAGGMTPGEATDLLQRVRRRAVAEALRAGG
jgi:hypothetical protein